ncbi:hypothetical protein BDV26DRAFT_297233 [Aspergillus bertholletiae]|uniref:Uncharacterized protein n=1 Tax=Aspergillus bertholletiae TaxID=1226010 RepID=A0A5N7ATB6_9EURO|nr:hypothetical protein BDV26DRAFT_297233 [Aspergillus bertholletiae]
MQLHKNITTVFGPSIEHVTDSGIPDSEMVKIIRVVGVQWANIIVPGSILILPLQFGDGRTGDGRTDEFGGIDDIAHVEEYADEFSICHVDRDSLRINIVLALLLYRVYTIAS